MTKELFFNKKSSLTIAKIVKISGCNISKEYDPNQTITNIATLYNATKNDLSFFNAGQYLENFTKSNAGLCFAQGNAASKAPSQMIVLEHDNPYYAYSLIAQELYSEKVNRFDQEAISQSAIIGKNCQIAKNVFIGDNVKIGDNCIIGPGSNILTGCKIGNNVTINCNVTISFATIGNDCILHHGVTIGQDGFGFAHNAGVNHKIIQIGIVEIGNNVEIGSNSCVDRGAIDNTIIEDGVKIDNLCQIAHNVKIGQGTVIAGCAAVAGSAIIGKFVQVGGQASISGHITIGDGAKIAGMSGVVKSVEPMQVVGGIPAIPIRKWHKINSQLLKNC